METRSFFMVCFKGSFFLKLGKKCFGMVGVVGLRAVLERLWDESLLDVKSYGLRN
jgi:hypothetical protein